MTEPTLKDLIDRIDQFETKLVAPDPPDMNKSLRSEIDRMKKRNTFTVDIDTTLSPTDAASGMNALIRKAGKGA